MTWKRHPDLLFHGLPSFLSFSLSCSSSSFLLRLTDRTEPRPGRKSHALSCHHHFYLYHTVHHYHLLSSTSFYSARLTEVEFSWSCPIFPGGIMLPMQMARSQRRSLGDSEKLTSSFFLTCTETTCKTKVATSCCLRPWKSPSFASDAFSWRFSVLCTHVSDRKHFGIWLSVSYRNSAYMQLQNGISNSLAAAM